MSVLRVRIHELKAGREMMKNMRVMVPVAAGVLGGWMAHAAAVSGVSGTIGVDTRCKADGVAAADENLDTRGYTADRSEEVAVDTRIPQGTMFILR
jgi:hypothetical protein